MLAGIDILFIFAPLKTKHKMYYTVKYKGNIIKVEVYEIDNYYQTGDTIKNCH